MKFGVMMMIAEAFTTSYFRVYPNSDMRGVSFGGAMKNIVAIACAISDGLGYGENTKAALMTRGLHEIRKLGETIGCEAETLNGLSGLGDLLKRTTVNSTECTHFQERIVWHEKRNELGENANGRALCRNRRIGSTQGYECQLCTAQGRGVEKLCGCAQRH